LTLSAEATESGSMIATIEQGTKTGFGLFFGLKPNEIDDLIQKLTLLKNGDLGHFHFRRDHFDEGSTELYIYDVELYLENAGEDNMVLDPAGKIIWPDDIKPAP